MSAVVRWATATVTVSIRMTTNNHAGLWYFNIVFSFAVSRFVVPGSISKGKCREAAPPVPHWQAPYRPLSRPLEQRRTSGGSRLEHYRWGTTSWFDIAARISAWEH